MFQQSDDPVLDKTCMMKDQIVAQVNYLSSKNLAITVTTIIVNVTSKEEDLPQRDDSL